VYKIPERVSKIEFGNKHEYDLHFGFMLLNHLGLASAYQVASVPGDADGDKVISAEELKVAEKDFSISIG
jgi:hypothetical protein